MLTLYHAPRSRSSRFVWLLEEIGQPFEIVYVDIRRGDGSGRGPDERNPHPLKKVPALVHDGAVVFESPAICLYLSDLFPEAGLGPQVGEPGRGEYLSWLAYYGTNVEPAMMGKFTNWAGGPPGTTGWESFDEMEARLAERLSTRDWFLGERFSTLDVLFASLLQWAARMFPEREVYETYKARVLARPALSRAMAKDEAPA